MTHDAPTPEDLSPIATPELMRAIVWSRIGLHERLTRLLAMPAFMPSVTALDELAHHAASLAAMYREALRR